MNKAETFIEAYEKCFGQTCADELAKIWVRVAETYHDLRTLEEAATGRNIRTPLHWTDPKAKEISLEAAVKIYTACLEFKARSGKEISCQSVRDQAEEIYQWLINADKA